MRAVSGAWRAARCRSSTHSRWADATTRLASANVLPAFRPQLGSACWWVANARLLYSCSILFLAFRYLFYYSLFAAGQLMGAGAAVFTIRRTVCPHPGECLLRSDATVQRVLQLSTGEWPSWVADARLDLTALPAGTYLLKGQVRGRKNVYPAGGTAIKHHYQVHAKGHPHCCW